MLENFLKNTEQNVQNYLQENNLNMEQYLQMEREKIQKNQNKFLETNLGKAIDGGINIGLKAILPNFIEDEIIAIKDSLITEGFSAAVDTAIEEAVNLGKSFTGIITGTFENISQVKKAIEKGGLVDTLSELLDTGIDWAKKQGYISKSIATAIKKGKNTIMNTIEDGIGNVLENQVEAIEKINGYIEKWQKYYDEQNFTNMEYQYQKIEEYLQEVIPLENILKKARTVENLHELIRNNGKDFNITQEQKELAEMLE